MEKVIGGADGPTSVLVSASIPWAAVLIGGCILIGGIIAVIALLRKK